MSKTLPALPSGTVTLGALSVRQRRFVEEYVQRGGKEGSGPDAAQAAGYASDDRNAARSRAHELLHNPKVLAALRDELTRKLSAGAVLGVQVLVDLAQNARNEQVKLGAARELLDRGYGPVVSRSVSAVARVGVEDLLAQLDMRAEGEGQPPDEYSESMWGKDVESKTIDGEAVDISDS
jgi:phage terminase small subunit